MSNWNSDITLAEWAEENPTINPFTNCTNITQLGGADLYYSEFIFRYGERYLFRPTTLVSDIQRVFLYNSVKFSRLLNSLNSSYDVFSNYRVEKTGDEITNFDTDRTKTGTEALGINLTQTETPRETETITESPQLTERKTETPRVETTITETPAEIKTVLETPNLTETTTPNITTSTDGTVTETSTPRVSTTTSTTPLGYTDVTATSRTTYDSSSYNPVESVNLTHTPSSGTEIVTVTPTSGTNEVETITDTEVTQTGTSTLARTGTNTTRTSMSGTNTTETSQTGTNTTETSQSGTNTIEKEMGGSNTILKTGTNTTTFNTTASKTGDETLSFVDRVDSGYMYRSPQDALEDEIKLARWSLIDLILQEVEQKVCLSVY